MDDKTLAGDLEAGDVIVLPGTKEEVLVRAVRLGQGGFVLTVSPVGDEAPAARRVVTFTAGTRLSRRRRVQAG